MRLTPWIQLILRKQSQIFCPQFPFWYLFLFICFFFLLWTPVLGTNFNLKNTWTVFQLSHAHGLDIHLPDSRRLFLYQGFYPLWYNLKKKKKCWKYQWSRAAMNSWAGCALHNFKLAPFGQTINVNDLLWDDALLSLYKWGWQLWKGIHITEGKTGEL